jgi:hypothetical protein
VLSPDDTEFRSTPQQYLEKVFQIPLWVPPMQAASLDHLVRGLTAPSGGNATTSAEAVTSEPADQSAAGIPLEDIAVDDLKVRESIDLAPRGLTLTETEIAFIGKLAPLLETPRAAKRLLNLYRLLKVGVAADTVARLEASPEHKAVLTLLAVMIASADEWNRFASALHTTDLTDWGGFVGSLRPRTLAGASGEEWTSGVEKTLLARHALSLRRLCQKLDELSPELSDIEVAIMRHWVDRVGRFSFGPT